MTEKRPAGADGPVGGAAIEVEVVYALPDRQDLVRLTVPPGTTAAEAIARSGLTATHGIDDIERHGIGIFSRRVRGHEPLRAGDRVEIYRPLTVDPMEARRRRVAARAAKGRAPKRVD